MNPCRQCDNCESTFTFACDLTFDLIYCKFMNKNQCKKRAGLCTKIAQNRVVFVCQEQDRNHCAICVCVWFMFNVFHMRWKITTTTLARLLLCVLRLNSIHKTCVRACVRVRMRRGHATIARRVLVTDGDWMMSVCAGCTVLDGRQNFLFLLHIFRMRQMYNATDEQILMFCSDNLARKSWVIAAIRFIELNWSRITSNVSLSLAVKDTQEHQMYW